MRIQSQAINTACIGLLCALPAVAYAEWPTVDNVFASFLLVIISVVFGRTWLLVFGQLTWWVIVAGVAADYFFVRYALGVPSKKAVRYAAIINIASIVAGILPISFVGAIWTITSYTFEGFSPIFWGVLGLLMCLCYVWVESIIYKRGFKLNVRFTGSVFWWCMLANAVSVGLAWVSIVIYYFNLL